MCFIKKGTNGRTLAPLAADWCRSLGVAYTINLSPPDPPPLIFEREKDAFICESRRANIWRTEEVRGNESFLTTWRFGPERFSA